MVLRDTWKTEQEQENLKKQKETVARLMKNVEDLETALSEKSKEAEELKSKFEEAEKKLKTLEASSKEEKQSLEKKIKEDEIALKNKILVCFLSYLCFPNLAILGTREGKRLANRRNLHLQGAVKRDGGQ